MANHSHLKFLSLTLGLLLAGIVNNSFGVPTELNAEKVFIPLSNSPQLTFTIPMKSTVSFFLLTSRNSKDDKNIVGKINISDQGCTSGHEVSVVYAKTEKEILTAYFPKEIVWGTTYKLGITQDAKTKAIILALNGETISITPGKKANFFYLTKSPGTINILDIEQH